MRPAVSVILLTTLVGAAQGLLLALYALELAGAASGRAPTELRALLAAGSSSAVALALLGLAASFFHLGHPARAWRAAAGWRSSWLSREVIALPAFIAALVAYASGHLGSGLSTPLTGAVAATLGLALFMCTGMIYASIRVVREWASPLTVANYALLGTASGLTLATALAAALAPGELDRLAPAAGLLTAAALVTRVAALVRNARLKPKATLQSALGIRHPRIEQKAQGATGGSFNTREFFHGVGTVRLHTVKWSFIALAFAVPLALIAAAIAGAPGGGIFAAAFACQFTGLLAERWFFFAEARHPQNLYYRSIA